MATGFVCFAPPHPLCCQLNHCSGTPRGNEWLRNRDTQIVSLLPTRATVLASQLQRCWRIWLPININTVMAKVVPGLQLMNDYLLVFVCCFYTGPWTRVSRSVLETMNAGSLFQKKEGCVCYRCDCKWIQAKGTQIKHLPLFIEHLTGINRCERD